MNNEYDNERFFGEYKKMSRSRDGLSAAGEWHQLKPLFPSLRGKAVLDLGCGYGWHCAFAADQGAEQVLGLDLSKKKKCKKTNRIPSLWNRGIRIPRMHVGLCHFQSGSALY